MQNFSIVSKNKTTKFLVGFFALVFTVSMTVQPLVFSANADHDPFGGVPQTSVKICHKTGNGYQANSPSVTATGGQIDLTGAHLTHQGGQDIVPPFHFDDNGTIISYPGKNWTPANQDIWNSNGTINGDCNGDGIVSTPTPTPVPATPTPTPVPATPTPTPVPATPTPTPVPATPTPTPVPATPTPTPTPTPQCEVECTQPTPTPTPTPVVLTVTITNAEGDGEGIVVDGLTLNCDSLVNDSVCTATYPVGTIVNLTATPHDGSSFEGSWVIGAGTCTGATTPCTVTVTGTTTLSAHFSISANPTPVPTPPPGGGGGGGGCYGNCGGYTPTPTPVPSITPVPTVAPQVLGATTTLPSTGFSFSDRMMMSLFASFALTGMMMLMIGMGAVPKKLEDYLN